jgi:cation diffusion facilitator CzcD-associated flavoprotein CzcO
VTPSPPPQVRALQRTERFEALHVSEHEFAAVFVTSGQFWDPVWPKLPGQASFKGRVTHSHDYRNNVDTAGKNVLFVGIGNSALDLSLEVALGDAEAVSISCRSGTTIIPVSDNEGQPIDQVP